MVGGIDRAIGSSKRPMRERPPMITFKRAVAILTVTGAVCACGSTGTAQTGDDQNMTAVSVPAPNTATPSPTTSVACQLVVPFDEDFSKAAPSDMDADLKVFEKLGTGGVEFTLAAASKGIYRLKATLGGALLASTFRTNEPADTLNLDVRAPNGDELRVRCNDIAKHLQ
jgi:hypothetical protein